MTKSTNEEMELKKNGMRMTKTYATDKQTDKHTHSKNNKP